MLPDPGVMRRRVPLQAAAEEQVQRPPLALTMTAE
jgi:hypothetical protein